MLISQHPTNSSVFVNQFFCDQNHIDIICKSFYSLNKKSPLYHHNISSHLHITPLNKWFPLSELSNLGNRVSVNVERIQMNAEDINEDRPRIDTISQKIITIDNQLSSNAILIESNKKGEIELRISGRWADEWWENHILIIEFMNIFARRAS